MTEKIRQLAIAYAEAMQRNVVAANKYDQIRAESSRAAARMLLAMERLKKAICEENDIVYDEHVKDLEREAGEKL